MAKSSFEATNFHLFYPSSVFFKDMLNRVDIKKKDRVFFFKTCSAR